MKNKNMKITIFSSLVLLGLFVLSCTYVEKDQIAGKGTPIIRMQVFPNDFGMNFSVAAFDAVVQTRTIVTMNREAVSSGDLNKSVTVDVAALGQSTLDAFNDSLLNNGLDTFLVLPPAAYTFVTAGSSGSTITFGPGDNYKELQINLDPSTLSFTASYAIPVQLSNATGGYKASEGTGFAFIQVIVKNKYDGIYEVNGTMVDAGGNTGAYPWEVALITNGATQVIMWDNEGVFNGYPCHLINNKGSLFGNFGLGINFNANDDVVSVFNPNTDPLPRNRTTVLEDGTTGTGKPAGINHFDAGTKTLEISYWLRQANYNPVFRVYFVETFTYKKGR